MIEVKTAIEFRDVVMAMGDKEQIAYVTARGSRHIYRVINPTQMSGIEMVDLVNNVHPPVLMETFATAMWQVERHNEPMPVIEIRTLDEL